MADEFDRRRFLTRAIVLVGGALAASFGIAAVPYILGPAGQREHEHTWVPLGAVTSVQVGTPTLFTARVERASGWEVVEQELSCYVQTPNGRDFVAFANVCPHLGCRVRWVERERQYFCPCHNAAFDEEGEVVSGPPPRPLDQFDVKVEGGTLLVHWDA